MKLLIVLLISIFTVQSSALADPREGGNVGNGTPKSTR